MRSLDALILDTADLAAADAVIVCDDPSGDLTSAALATGKPVHCLDADYTRAHAAHTAGALVAGIDGPMRIDDYLTSSRSTGSVVAVGEMPKSLGRLDYLARSIAGASAGATVDAASSATLILGGNNKHLSRSMNDTLGESFTEVAASRGRGKFRCLVASGPQPVRYEPARANGLAAFGGVFSGAREDYGGALLADTLLDDARRTSHPLGRVVDLGCGNGSVSKRLADAFSSDGESGILTSVTATDSDADAVLSARELLDGAAAVTEVTWDDSASAFPDGAFDTVALNPPFHDRAGVNATLAQGLLDASLRVLAPGGALYLVHNSHLRYRGEVEERFAAVEQIARNQKFTVLRARK